MIDPDAPMRLALAGPDDAEALTDISRRAFETDVTVGRGRKGGPPGYASVKWQTEMIGRASAYWKILLDEELIGGAIVISHPRGRYYLARIFIDPDHHHRGRGLQAMQLLFDTYPEARLWNLDTPPWNTRTRAFYEKLGFEIIRETETEVVYKKVVG